MQQLPTYLGSDQWEIMAQNLVEKRTLQHLLKCIVHDLSPQEAAESGQAKGLVGLDKNIMKYGAVQRRAKTAYKKDERFLVLLPGKLLLFKSMDIIGKHVRFVTSLFGAATRLVYGQLEFEVMIPDTKSLNLITFSAEELTNWIGTIEKSVIFANGDALGSKSLNSEGARGHKNARREKDLGYRDDQDSVYTARGKSGFSSGDSNKRDDHTSRTREVSYQDQERDYKETYDSDYQRGSKYKSRNEGFQDKEFRKQERSKDFRNQNRDGYDGRSMEAKSSRDSVISTTQNNGRREVDVLIGSGWKGPDEEDAPLSRKVKGDDRQRQQIPDYGNKEHDGDVFCPRKNDEAHSRIDKIRHNSYHELPSSSQQSLPAAPFQRKSNVSHFKQRSLDDNQFNMPHSGTMLKDNKEKEEEYNGHKCPDFEDKLCRNSFHRLKERGGGRGESEVLPRDGRAAVDYPPKYARENNAWKTEYAQPGGPIRAVRYVDERCSYDELSSQAQQRNDVDTATANRASVSHQLSQRLDCQINLRDLPDFEYKRKRGSREESDDSRCEAVDSVTRSRRESSLARQRMRDMSTQTTHL